MGMMRPPMMGMMPMMGGKPSMPKAPMMGMMGGKGGQMMPGKGGFPAMPMPMGMNQMMRLGPLGMARGARMRPMGGGMVPPRPGSQLSAAALANAPPSVQKQMIGEKLFPMISKIQPEQAGKITGMMLEMAGSSEAWRASTRGQQRAADLAGLGAAAEEQGGPWKVERGEEGEVLMLLSRWTKRCGC